MVTSSLMTQLLVPGGARWYGSEATKKDYVVMVVMMMMENV